MLYMNLQHAEAMSAMFSATWRVTIQAQQKEVAEQRKAEQAVRDECQKLLARILALPNREKTARKGKDNRDTSQAWRHRYVPRYLAGHGWSLDGDGIYRECRRWAPSTRRQHRRQTTWKPSCSLQYPVRGEDPMSWPWWRWYDVTVGAMQWVVPKLDYESNC